jgi:hypothetical protein
MTRIAKINDGQIIKALATLLHAANDFAPEDDPDKYDAWRAVVMSARHEYDRLASEVRAARSLSGGRAEGDGLRKRVDALAKKCEGEAAAFLAVARGSTIPRAAEAAQALHGERTAHAAALRAALASPAHEATATRDPITGSGWKSGPPLTEQDGWHVRLAAPAHEEGATRAPCHCTFEAGDSPCPMHGMDEEPAPAAAAPPARPETTGAPLTTCDAKSPDGAECDCERGHSSSHAGWLSGYGRTYWPRAPARDEATRDDGGDRG